MPVQNTDLDTTSLLNSVRIENFFNLKDDITTEVIENVAIDAAILIGICAVVWLVTRWIAKVIMKSISGKTKTEFDDFLVQYNFFKWLANIVPALILEFQERTLFEDILDNNSIVYRLTDALIVVFITKVIIAFVNASREFLSKRPNLKDKPLYSYAQLTKIFIYFFAGILVFSILSEKSPVYFLSAMGAMTAVILLIFKDTILGFVASIQLSANDMVRIGDWISMPKFGADGDVIEINLTTIKVKNFDNTITTIPTYSFISDSFKNWRGMEESGGRRIKRAIHIKVGSIQFCNNDMLHKFSKINLISTYIQDKKHEIEAYNKTEQIDDSMLINGRKMTNIGVFRVYIEMFLSNNSNINNSLTYMVRQLQPTENGLPIEIYAFSKVKEWKGFEQVVADLFDHILAAAPEFELDIFQNPSGSDFNQFIN